LLNAQYLAVNHDTIDGWDVDKLCVHFGEESVVDLLLGFASATCGEKLFSSSKGD
jgi:hypothetical protein